MAEGDVATAVNQTINPVDTFAEHVHSGIEHALGTVQNPVVAQIVGNPVVFFLSLAIAGFIIAYAFVFLSKTVVKAFTRRTETELDDMLLDKLQHPVAWSLVLVFLSIALVPLSLSSTLAAVLNRLLISGNILLIGTIVNRILAVLVQHYGARIAAETESTVDDHILPIVRKMITAVIYTIAVLVVLSVWGIEIAPLLAGAGIAGIAIAFAMQESLRNIFGGVSLAFDRAYAVGDRIKLNDGTVGTVSDISLRATKIRTFDGDLIVVPNGKIANENFQTYAQPTQETRVVVPFQVAYGTDLDKLRELTLTVVKGIPHQIDDAKRDMPIAFQFLEMGAYSLNCRIVFWVDDYRFSWDAKLEANRRIYDTLQKHKIEIPYPIQTVRLQKER